MLIIRVTSSELPPIEKKLLSIPRCPVSVPRSSAQTSQTTFSVGVRAAESGSPDRCGSSGSGSAAVSSLPLPVSGSSSSRT